MQKSFATALDFYFSLSLSTAFKDGLAKVISLFFSSIVAVGACDQSRTYEHDGCHVSYYVPKN